MLSNTPLVSIIVPVYNRQDIISETLECAIKQTYTKIEIIIFDNCSTDSTWKIVQDYSIKDSRIRAFRNDKNIGPVLNWKNCLEKVTGEYVKILWSDDLISQNCIEKMIEPFDSDTAFVMSGYKIFDSQTRNTIFSSSFQKSNYKSLTYLNDVLVFNRLDFPVSPACALFRKRDMLNSFVEQIPNEESLNFRSFGAGNDLLFYLITACSYKEVKCVNEFLAYFRSHENSITVSNKLTIYYEYSKYYLILNYLPHYGSLYKSKLFLLKIKFKDLANLYNYVDFKLKFTCLLKIAFVIIINKFNIKKL